MKTNKFYILIIGLLLVISLIAILLSKKHVTDGPGTPTPMATACSELIDTSQTTEFILYFRDYFLQGGDTIPIDEKFVYNFIDTALNFEIRSEIVKTCMCKKTVLLSIPPGVDPADRIAEADGRIRPSGDDSGSGISYGTAYANSKIRFGPHSNFSLLSKPITPDPDIQDYPQNKHSVKVAIIDTGYDKDHSSIKPHVWINPDEYFEDPPRDHDYNCIENDVLGADVFKHSWVIETQDNHGTAVAGKVIGQPDMPYPDTISLHLMNVKFTNLEEGDLFDATCAMRYAINEGADIIVASFGLYQLDTNRILKEVMVLAKEHNTTIIAAAGNHGTDIDNCAFFPASFAGAKGYEHVLSVGSTGLSEHELAEFSNYGKNAVLFTAPGQGIEVLQAGNSTTTGTMDGTSISTPAIARTVSIIKALNPDITPKELRECLFESIASNPDADKIKKGNLKHEDAINRCRDY